MPIIRLSLSQKKLSRVNEKKNEKKANLYWTVVGNIKTKIKINQLLILKKTKLYRTVVSNIKTKILENQLSIITGI